MWANVLMVSSPHLSLSGSIPHLRARQRLPVWNNRFIYAAASRRVRLRISRLKAILNGVDVADREKRSKVLLGICGSVKMARPVDCPRHQPRSPHGQTAKEE